MKAPYYLTMITTLLIGLFFFTGMEKLWFHQAFTIKLGRQPLPEWMKDGLAWGLPLAELAVVGLLAASRTRLWGLWAATLMMLGFAGYTAYAATEPTGYVPCACGKVFNALTWREHFWANVGLVALAMMGIWLYRQTQKSEKTAIQINGNNKNIAQSPG